MSEHETTKEEEAEDDSKLIPGCQPKEPYVEFSSVTIDHEGKYVNERHVRDH